MCTSAVKRARHIVELLPARCRVSSDSRRRRDTLPDQSSCGVLTRGRRTDGDVSHTTDRRRCILLDCGRYARRRAWAVRFGASIWKFMQRYSTLVSVGKGLEVGEEGFRQGTAKRLETKVVEQP